jgi:hypothetical protein
MDEELKKKLSCGLRQQQADVCLHCVIMAVISDWVMKQPDGSVDPNKVLGLLAACIKETVEGFGGRSEMITLELPAETGDDTKPH